MIDREHPLATVSAKIYDRSVVALSNRVVVMTERTWIQTPVDLTTRDEAAAVLASLGMTVPEAIELMLKRVARDKALPFEPFVPNDVTIAAMTEARERKGMRRAGSVAELIAELNAEDD